MCFSHVCKPLINLYEAGPQNNNRLAVNTLKTNISSKKSFPEVSAACITTSHNHPCIQALPIFEQELYNIHVVLGCCQTHIKAVVHYNLELISSARCAQILLQPKGSDAFSSTINMKCVGGLCKTCRGRITMND